MRFTSFRCTSRGTAAWLGAAPPRYDRLQTRSLEEGDEMSLFVVRHQHAAERCPAKDAQMGKMLLQHLSDSSAARAGISVKGEAVVNNEHTLYLILEADAQNR